MCSIKDVVVWRGEHHDRHAESAATLSFLHREYRKHPYAKAPLGSLEGQEVSRAESC